MKFSALLGDRAPEEAPIGLSHGIPGNSESGLGAIALLQAYQAAKLPGSIIDEVERLTQVERRINNYSEDEQFLLDRANSSPSQIVSVVLASEQQYVKYTKAHSAATLSPVYFDEPTFFQDYQLCVSASDWVTPAHKAAIDIIKKAALSAGIQQQAAELGFRPIAVSSESLAPYRVRTNLKLKQLPSPEGTMVSSILNQWETYSKPLALTILIQTSLSFPAEIFSVVQNSLHHFLSNKKSSTRVTLIGYANGTKSFATLSTDNHELASQMTLLQPQAGDTLYDGLRKAFEASLDETSLGFRRRLVILTTGRDAGSQADYDGLLSYATTKLSKEDLDVVALVAKVEGVDSSEFEQFIRQLGGNVRSASRDNVFDLLRAVF